MKFFVIIFLFSSKCFAQPSLEPQSQPEWVVTVGSAAVCASFFLAERQFDVLRWTDDSWSSRKGALFSKYDKVEHFTVAAVGHSALMATPLSQAQRIRISIAIAFWWEVKDSVAPASRYGFWGGEGFSVKDLIAGVVGVLVAELIFEIL